MEKRNEKLLLFVMVVALMSTGIDGKVTSHHKKHLKVHRMLKMLNKPSVISIKSEDGDTINCVDIYKQPAFDHPALKNHTIQMTPSYNPTTVELMTKGNESAMTVISQTWHKNGSCPIGTVPIRHIRKRDLLRAASLKSYVRKDPYIPYAKAHITADVNEFPQANRSMAYLITQGYSYLGARGDINVWNPYVEAKDEYSSAQIWLRNGPPDKYESVESGWMVNFKVYGDTRTRLFAYWTADSSTNTGCFDLTCSGFVQTNNQIALGAAIEPVSQQYRTQYQISIYVYMEPKTGNWWLQYGNKINIGYWPGHLFKSLSHNALYVMWGGEVYSSNIRTVYPISKHSHTQTHMGSGEYAGHHFGSACFIKNVRIMDYSLSLKFPEWIYSTTDEQFCYHSQIYREGYLTEPEFYFGGPGLSFLCP
ncbi:hypothetical protein AQUCO_00100187v1 [Aquilegia coerulea]|uniref:Neprosin PEP catalytic domain-containing protein n=1 Tax=Aquilegia coerulea TaxID=218851 RepID=A0A2G5F944_AQUCA|nr:hypothetical protein AQUCO_00100187v1 [Aquilegia coerulea]